jgi:fermentation-respiration switch protein FrsA (DUF1100 family)
MARWAGGLALAAAVLAGGLMFMESRLIYFPAALPAGWTAAGSGLLPEGVAVEECRFEAGDGVRLHGLLCRPAGVPEDPEGKVLLWFHGNAGNLADRLDMAAALCRMPVTVFLIDYRGYGLSRGRPSEKGLYRDAQAAWDHLIAERKVAPGRIVLFGKSLGGAVAVDLAARVRPAGLIVQSAFTSVPDMAAIAMPFVPRFLVRTKMDSLKKIRDIRCPVLFIHSPADEVVPYAMGRRLFEAAPGPKAFYEVPGAGHNETWMAGGEAYLRRLKEFIDALD